MVQSPCVTLRPVNKGLVLRVVYRLTVNGSAATGLTGPHGAPLDGGGIGGPSGDFVTDLVPSDLVGPSTGL